MDFRPSRRLGPVRFPSPRPDADLRSGPSIDEGPTDAIWYGLCRVGV